MSAAHCIPEDGDATHDPELEVKVPDSSVGGEPMIPVSYQVDGTIIFGLCRREYVMRVGFLGQTLVSESLA